MQHYGDEGVAKSLFGAATGVLIVVGLFSLTFCQRERTVWQAPPALGKINGQGCETNPHPRMRAMCLDVRKERQASGVEAVGPTKTDK